jgi:hypothetical protein
VDEAHKRAARGAIRALAQKVRWKPGKDSAHLSKRQTMGHLPVETTVAEYDTLIRELVSDPSHAVYHYPFGTSNYYAASGEIESVSWLAIFSVDGTMETAFPPDDLDEYLAKRDFRLIGSVGEIDDE